MKRSAFLAAGLAVLSLGLGALPATAEAIGNGGQVRLATSPAGTMSLPPFIIEKFALDEKYGFELVIVPYTDANSVNVALNSRAADAANLDWLVTARLRAGGVPIIGVAPFMTYVNSILVPTDSDIESLADLEGRVFGIHNRASFDWIMAQAAARQTYGIDLASAAEVFEGAPPLLAGIIQQGRLDATQMWNSIAAEMLASGEFRTMASIRELAENMGLPTAPFLMYSFREDYIAENPENVRAFLAAYAEVVEIMMTNDEVWELRGAEMNLSPEAIVYFRDQVRGDLLPYFTEDMEPALFATFDILLETAGADIIGLSEMPAQMLTMEFQ